MRGHSTGFLMLALALAACEAPGAEMEDAAATAEMPATAAGDAEAALETLRQDWTTAFNADDAAAVAELYADDAVFITPEGQVVRGREAIQTQIAETAGVMGDVRITADRAFVGADLVVEVGEYAAPLTAEGAETDEAGGTYGIAMQRQPDGSWKLVYHSAREAAPETEEPAAGG